MRGCRRVPNWWLEFGCRLAGGLQALGTGGLLIVHSVILGPWLYAQLRDGGKD